MNVGLLIYFTGCMAGGLVAGTTIRRFSMVLFACWVWWAFLTIIALSAGVI